MRETLDDVAAALECGDWYTALRLAHGLPAGPRGVFHWSAVLVRLAEAVRMVACGEAAAAWEAFGFVAGVLPDALQRQGERGPLGLVAAPDAEASWGARLACRVATLVWREQTELERLRTRFLGFDQARDELIEAAVEHLSLIEFSRWVWYPRAAGVDPIPAVAWTRKDLLHRATALRQFANPHAGEVSQSVWHDIRGEHGLRSAALARLAERDAAVPWVGGQGRPSVPVHHGRLWAWSFARRTAPVDYGNRSA